MHVIRRISLDTCRRPLSISLRSSIKLIYHQLRLSALRRSTAVGVIIKACKTCRDNVRKRAVVMYTSRSPFEFDRVMCPDRLMSF